VELDTFLLLQLHAARLDAEALYAFLVRERGCKAGQRRPKRWAPPEPSIWAQLNARDAFDALFGKSA